jgi:hypothetical protein
MATPIDGSTKKPAENTPTSTSSVSDSVAPKTSGQAKPKRAAEKGAASETKKPSTAERAAPKETKKIEKADEVKPIERNAYIETAKTLQRMSESWSHAYQPRLSTGETIYYFRERREHHEDHGRRDSREGRGAERAEGQGRRAGPGTGVELGLATALKKPHGGVESTEDVDAQLALNAAKFEEKGERALSAFEKALVARFEKGEQQAADSEDGQFHFLKKTAAEWKGFFENFLSRTIQKVVTWGDVQGFLFRGLLQAKGMPHQGVMISDVMTAAGIDKFARIAVPLNKAQALAATLPGAVLTKEAMQAVVGEQLRYAALAAAPAEDGAAQLGRAATRGMFASQQLENRVAEQLGFITDFRGAAMQGAARDAEEKRAAASRRRRGGMWSKLFGGDEVDGEGSVFVHWWRWDREDRGGFRRWFVAVFGAVIFVALFFLIIALVRALRP